MFVVSKAQVHIEGAKLVADASDLQFPVGGWPEIVAVVDHPQGPVANGWLFFRGRPIPHGDECGGYHTKDGEMELTVFND